MGFCSPVGSEAAVTTGALPRLCPSFPSSLSGQFLGAGGKTGDPKGRCRLWRGGSELGGLHPTPVLSYGSSTPGVASSAFRGEVITAPWVEATYSPVTGRV